MRRTQGIETSKYLQEKKSIEIPGVAASESGIAQTMSHVTGGCGVLTWECNEIAEQSGKADHRR